jgi:hypothetical protein
LLTQKEKIIYFNFSKISKKKKKQIKTMFFGLFFIFLLF